MTRLPRAYIETIKYIPKPYQEMTYDDNTRYCDEYYSLWVYDYVAEHRIHTDPHDR